MRTLVAALLVAAVLAAFTGTGTANGGGTPNGGGGSGKPTGDCITANDVFPGFPADYAITYDDGTTGNPCFPADLLPSVYIRCNGPAPAVPGFQVVYYWKKGQKYRIYRGIAIPGDLPNVASDHEGLDGLWEQLVKVNAWDRQPDPWEADMFPGHGAFQYRVADIEAHWADYVAAADACVGVTQFLPGSVDLTHQ